MTYRQAVTKRNIELVLMFPFVLAGKIAGYLFPLKTKHNAFLFFSSADIGGSIRVNADITECIRDKNPLIIFSKKPSNNRFRELFDQPGVKVIDLHSKIDNKLFHFINFFYRGLLSTWINRSGNPVVFGGECLYFYKVIPHIRKDIRKVELCHLNTWLNFSQAFVKYIDARIFSTPKIRRDVESQYRKNGVPAQYAERLFFTDNKIEIPVFHKTDNKTLQVIFVGRGAPQKRVHLIAAIAQKAVSEKQNVHFSFVGDVESLIPGNLQPFVTLYGNVTDASKLRSIYQGADVLLLTSAYEGLPLVIMEMMALGKVIVSTAIDGIPDYISDGENGRLIHSTTEKEIVDEGYNIILQLEADKDQRAYIGSQARAYAVMHFGGETFCRFYRDVLKTN